MSKDAFASLLGTTRGSDRQRELRYDDSPQALTEMMDVLAEDHKRLVSREGEEAVRYLARSVCADDGGDPARALVLLYGVLPGKFNERSWRQARQGAAEHAITALCLRGQVNVAAVAFIARAAGHEQVAGQALAVLYDDPERALVRLLPPAFHKLLSRRSPIPLLALLTREQWRELFAAAAADLGRSASLIFGTRLLQEVRALETGARDAAAPK